MLYPFKFKPLLKERIWGGERLAAMYGMTRTPAKPIGEAWLISPVPGLESVVSEGALKGNNIEELCEVFMGELLGEKVYEKYGLDFPLMVKMLDAREKLSVQVHPDDEMAGQRHGCYGKNELWYVVDCNPGACIYLGFKDHTDLQDYRNAVAQGSICELLNRIEVKPGGAYFVPAGTIHVIGEGILMAEISQASDVTYRLFDWNRNCPDGQTRELHTEEALDCIDFMAANGLDITPAPAASNRVKLNRSESFDTNLIKVEGEQRCNYSATDSFVILLCTEGGATVTCDSGRTEIKQGEAVMIPAQENEAELSGDATLLEIYIS